MTLQLLTRPDSQPKAIKGKKRGVLTYVLHLAPADLSGYQVCPQSSVGCRGACIYHQGHAGIIRKGDTDNAIIRARIRRTHWFFEDRAGFMVALASDVGKAIAHASRKGLEASFRLNGTSDIPWHRIPVDGHANLMAMFPTVQFYDYTKVSKRLTRERLPANYHLTFSLSENNEREAESVLRAGRNVAVVYRSHALVTELLNKHWGPIDGGFTAPVVSGDETDLRYLDPAGCVVALYAKGTGKRDTSGFVRDN